MGAGLPPPVGLLRPVDAAVVVVLDLAVATPKSDGILPVCEVALAVLIISVEDGLFVTLCGDDALGNPGAEEVHQAVGLEGRDVVGCCHVGVAEFMVLPPPQRLVLLF